MRLQIKMRTRKDVIVLQIECETAHKVGIARAAHTDVSVGKQKKICLAQDRMIFDSVQQAIVIQLTGEIPEDSAVKSLWSGRCGLIIVETVFTTVQRRFDFFPVACINIGGTQSLER